MMENPNHNNISEIFHSIYFEEFIYDSKVKLWFVLNENNIYEEEDDKGISIKSKIKEVSNKIEKYILDKNLSLVNEKQRSENYKLINKIISFCSNQSNKNYIVDCLKEYYNQAGIYEKMDNNLYLFAFNNIVFDLKTKKKRKAKPEDLITITCGYDYIEGEKDKRVKAKEYLIKILEDIIHYKNEKDEEKNKEEFEHILKTSAFCLSGSTKKEKYYTLLGDGGNGKGVWAKLMSLVLEKYYREININFVTGKDDSGSENASPLLAGLKKVRYLVSTEPPANCKLNSAMVKK